MLQLPRVAALVAVAVPVIVLSEAKDPCACLNWKQVYKKDMAMCGEGLEYHVSNPSRLGYARREVVNAFAFTGTEFEKCKHFFKKLDSDRCVNVGPYAWGITDWTGMSWCYVSKECDDLYGGKRLAENSDTWMDWVMSFVNDPKLTKVSELSWKLCRPGKDKALRDLPLEDVFKICERQGLQFAFCVKSAYLGAWLNFFWPQVHETWQARSDPEQYKLLPEVLRAAMAKREPIVVDTQPGGVASDLVVVRGEDLFFLQYNPDECPSTLYCRSYIESAPSKKAKVHSEL